MVPLPVDPEKEVNLRSLFFKINLQSYKDSITTNSLKIGQVGLLLEIWSHFRLTRVQLPVDPEVKVNMESK